MVISSEQRTKKPTVARENIKGSPTVTWDLLPDDFILPDDPVENIQQPPLAAALTDALGENGLIRSEMLIGSNFALVATIDKQTVVKAPDWFYVPYVQPVPKDTIRRSYAQHTEGDPVAVVMEFLSAKDCGELSVRATPPYGKLYFYEQILQVPTYITYDPYGPSLQVRCLENGQYTLQTADNDGRFWIPELQLYLGVWEGERLSKTTYWLRWWHKAGELLLWSSEQVEAERQKAEAERKKAEAERKKAEAERQKAEAERKKAEAERQRAEALAAKLRELGIDPDTSA